MTAAARPRAPRKTLAPAPSGRLEAVEDEAEADPDAPTSVLLDGETLQVLPARLWRSSRMRALREGDFDSWAEGCLTPESYEVWQEIDPTIEQVEQFMTNWQHESGLDQGNSRASRRSSKTTARR